MALIQCPECGREVSDQALACPGCGGPIRRESRVVVYGYTQAFALNPAVQVFWDGAEVGKVPQGGVLTIDVSADGVLSFRCNMRKAKIHVRAGAVTNVKLSWNRITGRLVPQIVETVTPGT